MEKIKPTLRASLDVDCPKCQETFDAFDQDDGGDLLTPIFNNRWSDLVGHVVSCPECGEEVELTEIDW